MTVLAEQADRRRVRPVDIGMPGCLPHRLLAYNHHFLHLTKTRTPLRHVAHTE